MNDLPRANCDQEELLEKLERVTLRTALPVLDVDLDSETAELREAWVAWTPLLDDCSRAVQTSILARAVQTRIVQRRRAARRRTHDLWLAGVAAAAASIACVAWYIRDNHMGSIDRPAMPPVAKVAEVPPGSPGDDALSPQLSWHDDVDEQISLVAFLIVQWEADFWRAPDEFAFAGKVAAEIEQRWMKESL